MMAGYQCWYCKIFFSGEGHFCFLKGKPDDKFTKSDVEGLEKLADEFEAAKRFENHARDNIGGLNPDIQGEDIQLSRSPERFRNPSKSSPSPKAGVFFSGFNPLLTNCQANSLRQTIYDIVSLRSEQNSDFRISEESSGYSFPPIVRTSQSLICQKDVRKSSPSKFYTSQKNSDRSDARQELQKKRKLSEFRIVAEKDYLDSASASPKNEDKKRIKAAGQEGINFRTVSCSSATCNPTDFFSYNENESGEEVVERVSVSDARAVSVAGPSGLQAQNIGTMKRKRFVCDFPHCVKAFISRRDLKRHHRVHTGEKPFVCSICNKGFSQESGLSSHQLTHTGEKKFECPKCRKTFGQKGNLKMHLLTHSYEKPFVCHICGKRFKRNNGLQVHLKTHVSRPRK